VRLDIVICTFNNAPVLARTLDSLAGQEVADPVEWSVLVVDNASTDSTAEVVETFRRSGRVPRIGRVYESRQGLVSARIRGVRETSAPWIAFVDDDCLLDTMWLAGAASFVRSHPSCGGFGGIVRLKFEAAPDAYVRRYGYSFAEQEHGDREQPREWLVGAGMVLSREALYRSGWICRQYLGDRQGRALLSGGDMEMVLRIRSAGYDLWYTPSCLIHHSIPPRRTSVAYLTRINFGLGVSQTWCDFLSWPGSYRQYLAATVRSIAGNCRHALRQAAGTVLGKRRIADFRITSSFARGRIAGLIQVARLDPSRRLEVQGCARTPRALKRIALLHWGDVIEDFLGEIEVTLDQFREEMTGGWMFGYIRALQTAGVETTLICVSAGVNKVEWSAHRPTGAAICFLPATGLYRRLRGLGISPAVWKNPQQPNRSGLRRFVTRLLQDLLPYCNTPIGLLRRELESRRIQVILCQEYEHPRFDLSVLAGMLSGVPVFATFQGGDTQFSRFERLFRRMTIARSAGLIIGSSRETDRVRNRYAVPESRLARIFNPLDLSVWYAEDRRAARLSLQLPESASLVIWHGRIDLRRKGLDILLYAWCRLRAHRPDLEACLVLIGNGSDADELHQRIAGVPRVIWRQEYVLDRNVMRRYLSAGDVYAFPSRHEGFPVALLEAMACGLPVTATDCVGVRDILSPESGGGVVVPAEDAARLAEALAVFLDDEPLRRKTGCQARACIEQSFSLESVGSRLRDFLAVSHQENGGSV
jgi:starch synthase